MATVDFGLARATEIVEIDSKELLANSSTPGVDPVTGTLRAFTVMSDPEIVVVPGFLSDAECDHLMRLVEGAWRPSQVSDYQEHGKVDQVRTSWSCTTRRSQTSVVQNIENRLASVAGLPVSQLEKLSLVRYAPGEHFEEHHDGKERPLTVFVYLNDLLEDDTGGDTFFPVLGLSFKPRRGTAVVWTNATPEGKEDSRMVHVGQAPSISVKYAVNCFFTDVESNATIPITPDFALNDARVVNVRSLAGERKVCLLHDEPRIQAVSSFLGQSAVAHLLKQMTNSTGNPTSFTNSVFEGGSQVIHVLEMGATETIQAVEAGLSALANLPIAHLSQLRIVQPGTRRGLGDRGLGCIGVHVCLTDHDDVFFPSLGLRVELQSGDALIWANAKTVDNQTHEDLRTHRFHVGDPLKASSVRGLEASLHGDPVRPALHQHNRFFVRDAMLSGS